jgi:hypothetical protein
MEVVDGFKEKLRIIAKCPKPCVAVQAQDPPDRSRGVIVIDLCCWGSPADRAGPPLSICETRYIFGFEAVASPEVVPPCATPFVFRHPIPVVMTLLAIRGSPTLRGAIPRKLGFWLLDQASRATH